jgi:general transcription factor 3C polypeptide 3 (transcription factor C subunit 4)
MAFLTRYRALRQAEVAESDEVEYNFGRAFQQLGEQGLSDPFSDRSHCQHRTS